MSNAITLYCFINDEGRAIALEASGVAGEESDLVVTARCLNCNAELCADRYTSDDYRSTHARELSKQITLDAARSARLARTHVCGATTHNTEVES